MTSVTEAAYGLWHAGRHSNGDCVSAVSRCGLSGRQAGGVGLPTRHRVSAYQLLAIPDVTIRMAKVDATVTAGRTA